MELEKLRDLIKNNKAFQDNPACIKLVESFDEFIELYQMQKLGIADTAYMDRFQKCFETFWTSFDEAATSLGIPPDLIKENMNNPEFFTPEQWESVQLLREEVEGQAPEEKKVKIKKNNKNVRI